MKIIFVDGRAIGTATDDHIAADGQVLVDEPGDFDMDQLARYRWTLADGVTLIPLDRHITKLAFRNRFTQAEKIGIEIASLDDPTASLAARQQKAAIRVSLADSAAATFIDLDRSDTRAGVIAMETATLLAAGRALIILDADIADAERPLA